MSSGRPPASCRSTLSIVRATQINSTRLRSAFSPTRRRLGSRREPDGSSAATSRSRRARAPGHAVVTFGTIGQGRLPCSQNPPCAMRLAVAGVVVALVLPSAASAACLLHAANMGRTPVEIELPNGRVSHVQGYHKLPTVVTHPSPGQTVTTGGYAGGVFNAMLQPGDIVTINGRPAQLLDNCELPRDENYDSGRFGADGLRVDAYNPALYVNKSPVFKHARGANGREYISEEIWGNHHVYYSPNGSVIRDEKINPALP